jgi:hypothetical protein
MTGTSVLCQILFAVPLERWYSFLAATRQREKRIAYAGRKRTLPYFVVCAVTAAKGVSGSGESIVSTGVWGEGTSVTVVEF